MEGNVNQEEQSNDSSTKKQHSQEGFLTNEETENLKEHVRYMWRYAKASTSKSGKRTFQDMRPRKAQNEDMSSLGPKKFNQVQENTYKAAKFQKRSSEPQPIAPSSTTAETSESRPSNHIYTSKDCKEEPEVQGRGGNFILVSQETNQWSKPDVLHRLRSPRQQ